MYLLLHFQYFSLKRMNYIASPCECFSYVHILSDRDRDQVKKEVMRDQVTKRKKEGMRTSDKAKEGGDERASDKAKQGGNESE